MSTKFWNIVTAVALSATLVAAVSVKAAVVTSANDTLSTLRNNVAANHLLLFTTPSGVNEGENITISFATNFDTSEITEDDIDIKDDSADLTTATDCSGTEKISATVAADILTITVCPGDSGTIAAGSEIELEIGNNTTFSGTGTNQITNPISAGTYFISIAGSFGDFGTIALPIGSNGDFSVDAEVEGDGGSESPSGSGTPTGCGDTTAPIISGIFTSGITESSASISWTTNEDADGTVNYGLTTAYELGEQTNDHFVTSRTISLSGLLEGREYHFQVASSDLCENLSTSSDYTFTTLDTHAPEITDIEVVDISTTSARITWKTNEPASSLVSYGTSTSYNKTASDTSFETLHSTVLIDLLEGTTYHFSITATDASGNSVSSSDQTFSTTEDLPPSNVTSLIATAGDTENLLTWIPPDDSDLAGVKIISCLGSFPSGPTDSGCSTIYNGLGTSFVHSGLTNGVTYYYGAFAYDEADQYASGALASATPEGVLPEEDVCGDGTCGSSETSALCPVDCTAEIPPEVPDDQGNPEDCTDETCEPTGTDEPGTENGEEPAGETDGDGDTETCGNGTCSETESIFTCPDDCPTTEPIGSTCGDAICGSDETSELCPSDCPTVEIPSTTVTDGEIIPSTDVSFITRKGSFKLEPDADSVVDILVGSEISIIVSAEHIKKDVQKMVLVFGAETYLLTKNNNAYSADVTVSDTPARYALLVIINYQDGTNQTLSFIGNLLSPGLVYEKSDQQNLPISGALVTLMVQQNGTWVVWDGSPWNQSSPINTVRGNFSWYVENGNYQIVVKKSGYLEATSKEIKVANHIFNPQIELEKIVIPSSTGFLEMAATSFSQTVEKVSETIETVRESPSVQTTVSVTTPVIVVAALTSTVVLAAAFDLFPLLQLLFTSPILLINRRKRKNYGVVYHALTKIPVDLALVRIYRATDHKMMGSRVTDKAGRYFFLMQPGAYCLEVVKKNFTFPSQTLANTKDDAIYLDVYHGENITVSEKNALLTPNIPLDPIEQKVTQLPGKIKSIRLLRKLQKWSSLTGLILSIFVLAVSPSILTATVLGAQIIIYALVRRLATPSKPKSWGIVYDHSTNRPLANVIVRIFETKYHKLLETSLTNPRGQYTFLLGPNQYSSTFEKTGFQTVEVAPIDYEKNPDIREWAQDIKLKPNTNQ